MKFASIAVVLAPLALVVGVWFVVRDGDRLAPTSVAITPSEAAAAAHPEFLYGRIETVEGATYEGRLRWGGDEEAFWDDAFDGWRDENPWAVHAPPERLVERRPIEFFGVEIADRSRRVELGRPFMARFGDLALVEARGRDVLVTLKSGTVFTLDGFDAGDFDDGVRVWDGTRGVVDVESRQIRTVEFLWCERRGAAPDRLHGTVRTRRGDFTGFVHWNRDDCFGSDELVGRTADGELRLRFETVRSIARRSRGSFLVTLRDGREIALTGERRNRGVAVDDPRYGRVRVRRDAFERVDFDSGSANAGPTYQDFPPGRPLTGRVTTGAGRRFAGRLVFDLDESETTETLDAPSQGVNFAIPFGLIASIVPVAHAEDGGDLASVTLHSGEELRLERAGDLGERNAGLLIFVDEADGAEYVSWTDAARVDFARPPAMHPPLGGG